MDNNDLGISGSIKGWGREILSYQFDNNKFSLCDEKEKGNF